MKAFAVCFTVAASAAHVSAQSSVSPGNGQQDRLAYLIVASSTVQDGRNTVMGNLEAVAMDPNSRQVQFALVSFNYPTNRTVVTPIPWQMLQFQSDSRAAGGIPGTLQKFVVNTDAATLLRAPRINWAVQARSNDAAWVSATMGYFGGTTTAQSAPPTAAGAVNSGSGVQTGGESSSTNSSSTSIYDTVAPPADDPVDGAYGPSTATYEAGGGGLSSVSDYLTLGTNLFGPNFLSNVLGSNVSTTNLTGANALAQTNLFTVLTNFFATNVFNPTNGLSTNGLALTPFGSNFVPGSFQATNPQGVRTFTTNRVGANAVMTGNVGAPAAGSGTNSGFFAPPRATSNSTPATIPGVTPGNVQQTPARGATSAPLAPRAATAPQAPPAR